VAIRSDTTLFSEGLVSLLGHDPSVTILDAASGSFPHVILLDGRMEGALAQCAALARRHDGPRVLVVAGARDEEWTAKALRAGARGILQLHSGVDLLSRAIRVVREGHIWAPRRAVAATSLRSGAANVPLSDQELMDRGLSTREREICHHVACGLSNKEVADRLFISPATVKAHLTRVFRKLGLGRRSQLAAMCWGMSPLEPPSASPPGPRRE
jgi:DNA-binding NarL/FixJ family response regulator